MVPATFPSSKGFVGCVFSRPGAAALAGIALYAGIAGLLHIGTSNDILQALMPWGLTATLNVVYTLAGVAMLVGMGIKRGNIEAAGWILLGASVLVRGTAILIVAGLTTQTIGLVVLYAWFFAAALVRVIQIVRGDGIVVIHVERQDR